MVRGRSCSSLGYSVYKRVRVYIFSLYTVYGPSTAAIKPVSQLSKSRSLQCATRCGESQILIQVTDIVAVNNSRKIIALFLLHLLQNLLDLLKGTTWWWKPWHIHKLKYCIKYKINNNTAAYKNTLNQYIGNMNIACM